MDFSWEGCFDALLVHLAFSELCKMLQFILGAAYCCYYIYDSFIRVNNTEKTTANLLLREAFLGLINENNQFLSLR